MILCPGGAVEDRSQMKFEKLRLTGFKSFVEPTDFEIRPGLTGIVGPNGCGKSNLLESLRWVMGATSAKALRGGGMEDVIFAGTSNRPPRNWAEVTLWIDNNRKELPAEFNGHDQLEISRRILKKEDGSQSVYKVNGKDVRARDIQLLFADASTGANSPALVRQGQISELINSKPQNRRKLLEEAAGITGLHTRRHEAELRLKAAETNLERLDDVTGELETHRAALAKQARQATRYRNLSGDIRRTEAMLALLRHMEASEAVEACSKELEEIRTLLEETSRAAAAATAHQTRCHEALPPLREKEAETAAALHRLNVAMEGLDAELSRARREEERLQQSLEQLERDLVREKDLGSDAGTALEQLATEEKQLKTRKEAEAERLKDAGETHIIARDALEEAERAYDRQQTESAALEAERRAMTGRLEEAERRHQKLVRRLEELESEKQSLALPETERTALRTAEEALEAAKARAEDFESQSHRAEDALQQAVQLEKEARQPRDDARRKVTELKAEAEAIRKILAGGIEEGFEPVLERITAKAGYENALAAALGDTLSASLEDEASSHWSPVGGENTNLPPLPMEAKPLSDFVSGPPALTRRLASIGVVYASDGTRLQASLAAGQRLVTVEGDLWRWDGYVQKAEAKTAAAIRLEQKNRLAVLEDTLAALEDSATAAQDAHETAQENVQTAEEENRLVRTGLKDARQALGAASSAVDRLRQQQEEARNRLAAISGTAAQVGEDTAAAASQLEDTRQAVAALPDLTAALEKTAATREALATARNAASEARAVHADLQRDAESRDRRLEEIARERGSWTSRAETAGTRLAELEARIGTEKTALETAKTAPEQVEEKRKALFTQIDEAESRRRHAADALAEAENAAREADQTLKAAEAEAVNAREAKAGAEARTEGARAQLEQAVELAREHCEAAPEELMALSEHKEDKPLPSREDIERKLERYKRERENLGGVNLRADSEMEEIDTRLSEISTEREDCEAAIRKLRASIGSLNKEGRVRLLEAFETVNTNFQKLFTRLFGGGQAELRLIDSDDPLDAGLEIFASPPGKKLTSMSLMSGGEQALTATSLIFAVFMANPAPVCVLDEVDAPLDDANVDRFCQMLHEMASETETKFIIITHHALTMSRMDRLYGVTMIERGVSQLVSVDLSKAEQMVAAAE